MTLLLESVGAFTKATKRHQFFYRLPLHVGAYNVRTLNSDGQQVSFAHTLPSVNGDICCFSEVRI